MKIKSVLIFLLSFFIYEFSFGQYLEFKTIVGDTNIQNASGPLKQISNDGYFIEGAPGRLFKIDKNGDSVYSFAFKKVIDTSIQGIYNRGGRWDFDYFVSNKSGLMDYGAVLDLGYIKLFRKFYDSLGTNQFHLYTKYRVTPLDSGVFTHPDLNVKYLPEAGFYLYGASPLAPDSSYVIWKFDTAGKLLWRQDYSDTCNGSNFNLHILKNKLLLTSYIYNKHYTGVRLVFLDTLGNFFQEKKVGQPLIPYVNQVSNCKSILMPDSSIIISLDLGSWKFFPWPLVIKFDKKLDTVWHRFIMLPRDVNNIDVNIDMTQIVKMIPTADSNLAILWHKSFYDNNNYHQMLRQYKPDGSLIGEIAVDSVDNNALIGFNDIIATSDKGFALAGATGAPHYNSWLVKLSSKKITAVQEAVQDIGGGISIYPNPAGAEMRVRFDIPLNPSRIKSGTGSSKGELHARTAGANIRLYDIHGKVVREYSMQTDGGRELIIERQGLPAGIYMLKVQDGQGRMFMGKVEME